MGASSHCYAVIVSAGYCLCSSDPDSTFDCLFALRIRLNSCIIVVSLDSTMCTDSPWFVYHLAGIDAAVPSDSDVAVVAAFDSAVVRQQTPRHQMTGCERSGRSCEFQLYLSTERQKKISKSTSCRFRQRQKNGEKEKCKTQKVTFYNRLNEWKRIFNFPQ